MSRDRELVVADRAPGGGSAGGGGMNQRIKLPLSENEARLLLAVLGCTIKQFREDSTRGLTRVAELFAAEELSRIRERLERLTVPRDTAPAEDGR